MQTREVALWVALCAFVFSGSAVAQATPDVGIVDGQIRLAGNQQTAVVPALVYAESTELLRAPKPDTATITDMTPGAGGVTVTFGKATIVNIAKTFANNTETPQRIEWRTDATVAGLAPNTSVTHDAILSIGNEKRRFRYEITNKTSPHTWTLAAPPDELAVRENKVSLPFSVTVVGNGERSSVFISRLALRDDTTLRVASSDAVSVRGNVGVGTPSALTLIADGSKLHPGKYAGIVELAATGATDTKTFPLTVYASTQRARFLGFLAIVAGIVVAWFISGYARNRTARLDALLPARRLAALAQQLRLKLKKCRATATHTQTLLDEVDADLAVKYLTEQRFLPGRVPWPFPRDINAEGYGKHLAAVSTRLESLTYLVDSGFCRVRDVTSDEGKIKIALEELDQHGALPLAELKPKVAEILAAAAGRGLESTFVAREDALTVEQILFRVDLLNAFVWLLWAAITAIGGYLLLVEANAGFGTLGDIGKAFLWGLGVQVAGQQFQQLTPSGISTSIGVKIPAGAE